MSVAIGLVPRFMPARLAAKSGSSPSRWFTSESNAAAFSRLLASTWLTTTPEQIAADDIVSSLPVPGPDSGLEYTPIFLVTPAFANWVDTENTFLRQCMNRFYKDLNRPPHKPIHAVVAIVDCLPNSCSRDGDADGDTEAEGISLLLSKEMNVRGKSVATPQVRSVEKEDSALLISFKKGMLHGETAYSSVHEIGLRLANTIFLNGKENTLFGTRWVYESSTKSFDLEKTADLSACSITVTPTAIQDSLKLPIYPVGERRKVISSMGNILRQIAKDADGKSDEPMPASSELEKELPRYIAEHNISDRRVSVWALIETTPESPYTRSNHSQGSLAKSIQMGAKLHRVMSGGGGWGKKQGLLSLDPETTFRQARSESLSTLHNVFESSGKRSIPDLLSPYEPEMSMGGLSSLSQVAEPGNYVQFFASVEEGQPQVNRDEGTGDSDGRLSFDFGVMSDAVPALHQGTQHKDLTVVPNRFGALSEKAVTYLQPVSVPRSNDPSDSCTKIDIPGSRVSLVLG
ncbi:hypothetical protein BJX61DRAFT_318711 [Aspergillus egyptiacus]|nr:hypothetical protein BJX61DRAFT_318711 [Aspergillus egyptiacus]